MMRYGPLDGIEHVSVIAANVLLEVFRVHGHERLLESAAGNIYQDIEPAEGAIHFAIQLVEDCDVAGIARHARSATPLDLQLLHACRDGVSTDIAERNFHSGRGQCQRDSLADAGRTADHGRHLSREIRPPVDFAHRSPRTR